MRRQALLLPFFVVSCALDPLDESKKITDDMPMSLPPLQCGVRTACGRSCVDLQSDPLSCGACDRTCVIPNATAACNNGQCAIAACTDGFYDTDGKIGNGCEAMSRCVQGGDCQTRCETTGVASCVSGMQLCTPPAETCNGIDDDCNGSCDEGALPGCRVGVHRAIGSGGHFYTTDLSAASTPPYSIEAANYFRIYASPIPGSQPMYLCDKGRGMYFLTSSTSCEALNIGGRLLGYWSMDSRCGAQPLYRLYNSTSGDHFYTVSDAERQAAVDMYGYTYESVAAYVWLSP